MSQRIGLFGGTFDPPHLGHLILAQSLADAASLDRVIFIPAGRPPHKRTEPISSAAHRLKMLALAIDGHPAFEISTYEINATQPSYTIDTVRHFQATLLTDDLYWMIGSDSLCELHTWRQFEELVKTIDILTAHRGGFDISDVLDVVSKNVSELAFEKLQACIVRTPMIEISASHIRWLVAEGREIRYLVPDAVRDYILREGLYR